MNPQKAEFEFRDLFRKPEKLFGYAYPYVLVALASLGIVYVNNLTVIGNNAITPVFLKDSSALVRDIARREPSVIPPVDVKGVGVPSDSLVARGRALFRANCSSCHGENGMGDGPAGVQLNPHPRNFHLLTGWTNGPKVTQIYKTLQEGIVKNGMASYSYLPPIDRFALIHYIRTFCPSAPVDSARELEQLDITYQLSKGTVIPGQIPVVNAEAIIARESAPLVKGVSVTVQELSESRDPGAIILRGIANDPHRIIVCAASWQKHFISKDDFVRAVSADPLQYGFKAAVVNMSDDEWSAAYRFLTTLQVNRRG